MAEGNSPMPSRAKYIVLTNTPSGTSNKDRMDAMWNGCTIEGETVIGSYNYQGAWLFMIYKYVGGENGMLIAMPFHNSGDPMVLQVVSNTRYYKNVTTTTL